MNLTSGRVDAQSVQVLSDPGDREIVVRMPYRQWRELLLAAGHYFESQATSVADVLLRLQPSPSMAEIAEIKESYDRDAAEIARLLA